MIPGIQLFSVINSYIMRYYLLGLFLICFLVSTAQTTTVVEQTIRGLEEKVVKAILQADTTLLNELWSPDFMVNTPRNDVAKNRAAVMRQQRAGLINYSVFEREVESILIEGDIVVTMGREVFVSRTDIPGAKAGERVRRRFTNIWKQTDGRWVQLARHASIVCK